MVMALAMACITRVFPAFDGDTISRWDPTRGHHKRFSVKEELYTVREHFARLDKVLGKTPRAWTLGNHDVRLSRYVAVKAPELTDMDGMRLEDWAPQWPLILHRRIRQPD